MGLSRLGSTGVIFGGTSPGPQRYGLLNRALYKVDVPMTPSGTWPGVYLHAKKLALTR